MQIIKNVLELPLTQSQVGIWFLGQEGFLIKFRGTVIAIDPYLSAYVDENCSDKVRWKRAYAPPILPEKLDFVDSFFFTHTHYDHADPYTIRGILKTNSKAVFVVPAPEVETFVSYAGLLGMGVIEKGCEFELSGTSEHIGKITAERSPDAISTGYFNGYVTYGGTKSSGESCSFTLKNLSEDCSDFALKNSPPIFLPYLSGERAPIYDENARGVYFGLNAKTTKNDLAYSSFEGVAFSLFDIAKSIGITDGGKLVCGGGSCVSDLMNEIKAELFDKKILTVRENDASALGAAMIAATGAGAFNNIESAVRKCVKYDKEYIPTGKYKKILRERFSLYRKLYRDLKNDFKTFAKISEGKE